MAKKPVQEPYRSNNARWIGDALQKFWRDNKDAQVEDKANENYRRQNPGGGSTRGENARNIIRTGTVKIKGVRNLGSSPLQGHSKWSFEVISQGSKGSAEKFYPTITLEPKRAGRADSNMTETGEVTQWECQCGDYKFRRNVCKHILAGSVAMWSRVKKVKGGRLS